MLVVLGVVNPARLDEIPLGLSSASQISTTITIITTVIIKIIATTTTTTTKILAFMNPEPAPDSPPPGQAGGASAIADVAPPVLPDVQSAGHSVHRVPVGCRTQSWHGTMLGYALCTNPSWWLNVIS